ncbi:MAG TPA: glutamine-hydrolyzing carbamoyl-phosphate synthase small subunit [Acidimicrobiales bacterium]|nr:glutamine-hydrolyzing carbamoyl-phosphate synthase small subunit [Acidimicrobiales bacterium]
MSRRAPTWRDGLLALADGSLFEGEVLGFPGQRARVSPAAGEVVFNTVMAGYQEVITDPSYAGQMITFTYPHIGNYGVSPEDYESRRPFCNGVIVRQMTSRPSNWRASSDLAGFLLHHEVPAMAGADTRRLARQLREAGAMPGAFGPVDGEEGAFEESSLLAAAKAALPTDGRDLVSEVTCDEPYQTGDGPFDVVAYDFGIKRNILRNLGELARVTVVPAGTTAQEVLALGPDGVFLSNGPGDPAALAPVTKAVADLLGLVPVFGICLGHQVLAQALGASTYKLPFGHHGGNHPVKRVPSGTVEITSQNHNYAVAESTFAEPVAITHINLNDGVIEGFACKEVPAFSVQYHPEAAPGPHDARYLFGEFASLMRRSGANGARRSA